MDIAKLRELLRAIFRNPFFYSYIRSKSREPHPELDESTVSPEARRILDQVAATKIEPVSPAFKLVFLAVLVRTFGSMMGAVLIAFLNHGALTENQQTVFDTMNTTWKMGIAAILGLLGGKST